MLHYVSLSTAFPGGQKLVKSIEDLKLKFKQEYPEDKLISIPVVKLQNYSSVPVHLTEDDIRANIKVEEEEVLLERIPLIEAKKRDVLDIIKIWSPSHQSQLATEKAAKDLHNLLFELIFVGDKDCACQRCQTQSCALPSSRKCKINKGELTQSGKASRALQYKWEEVLGQMLPHPQPDQNLELIEKIAGEELRKAIHAKMENEIQGILANMIGRNTENNLIDKLELLLHERRGLLLNGFNVRKNLKLFFDAFNVKLKEYPKNTKSSTGGKVKLSKERKEIEHDVLHMAPHKDKVLVSFVQAKSQLNVPWTEPKRVENARKVIEAACSQGVADIETFSELTSYFLTEKEFKLILFNFNITMSNLSKIPETEICANCRDAYVYDEEKGKEYESNQLLSLFGQPQVQEAATSEADNIYLLLAAIYAGGGSLVKLKCSKEKYKKENFYLKQANKAMQKAMKGDQPLDETTARPLYNVKTGIEKKWISRNMNIKLSPSQNNLYNSGIGLKGGYCMIGGHGTGKSMMIQLEVSRASQLHTEEGTKAEIFVVVWEMKAKELLESYKQFVKLLHNSKDIEVKVLNKEELCQKTKVLFLGRDTASIINDVNKKLSETTDRAVYLFIDEIEVENPGAAELKDLVGKTPFCHEGSIFPWSNLDPLQVHLVVAVTTDSQDLARLLDIKRIEAQTGKSALVSAPAEKIPTVVLWRVFRCSNAIQETVKYLQLECSKKDKEFGFAVNPSLQINGHDVRGDTVEWIQCFETEHMICPNKCAQCFLFMIESALEQKIARLNSKDGVPLSEITVIVSLSHLKRTPPDNLIREFFARRYPDVNLKLNFEMEGLEAPVVILIRNGGHLGSSISLGMSRATTKLVFIGTDDSGIMENAVRYRKASRVETVNHIKISDDSKKARWTLLGTALHHLHRNLADHVDKELAELFKLQIRFVLR